jgi:hypothetical protein
MIECGQYNQSRNSECSSKIFEYSLIERTVERESSASSKKLRGKTQAPALEAGVRLTAAREAGALAFGQWVVG